MFSLSSACLVGAGFGCHTAITFATAIIWPPPPQRIRERQTARAYRIGQAARLIRKVVTA